MPRTSEYYRRYAEELRAVADRRITYEGLLATLDLAETYDQMADQMAVAEEIVANDYRLFQKTIQKTKNQIVSIKPAPQNLVSATKG